MFAIMWALGILLGFLSGMFSGFFHLGKSVSSIGSAVDLVMRFTFFIRVIFFGFVATPATAIAIYLSKAITGASLMLPGLNENRTSLSEISIIAVVSEAVTGGLLAFFNMIGSLILRMQTSGLSIALLMVLVLSPVFYGFSIVGRGGLAVWRLWVGFWLVTLTATPIIAWWLAVGNVFVKAFRGNGILAAAAPVGALITIWGACLIVAGLIFLYYTRGREKVQPAFVRIGSNSMGAQSSASSQRSTREPGELRRMATMAAGTAIGNKISQHGDTSAPVNTTTPRTSGGLRMKSGTALGVASKAVTAAHPVAGIALGVVGAGVTRSGRKSFEKSQVSNMAPPSGTPVALPAPKGVRSVPLTRPASTPSTPPAPAHHVNTHNPATPQVFLPVKRRDQTRSQRRGDV